MEFEVGKEYVSEEYGIVIKVTSIDGDIVRMIVSTEGTEGTEDTEGKKAPVLIKKYDYFRLPFHTQYLHSYINAFLRIYNTVSIQKTADYYILQCERLEKE